MLKILKMSWIVYTDEKSGFKAKAKISPGLVNFNYVSKASQRQDKQLDN